MMSGSLRQYYDDMYLMFQMKYKISPQETKTILLQLQQYYTPV